MKSISFPKMISHNYVQTVSDYDATLQNMKLLLGSEKGEFVFDPFFGIRLKRYTFEQNNKILMDILIDEIYEQLVIFMPQLIIKRKDITLVSEMAKIYVNINAQLNNMISSFNNEEAKQEIKKIFL